MAFQFIGPPSNGTPAIKIERMGLELQVRLSPALTAGELTVLETLNAPGFGPPSHRHRETAIFRVLEGRYLFPVETQTFFAETGALVSVPGQAAHAFVNVTARPARQLVMMLPGMEAERFFTGLGDIMAQGQPGRAALNAFGAGWGVEFLGPPLVVPPLRRGIYWIVELPPARFGAPKRCIEGSS